MTSLNLKDNSIKLIIINSINEEIQQCVRGLIRDDIDILAYKVDRKTATDTIINLPDKYINTPLTADMKKELCIKLNIINTAGTKNINK